MELVDGPTGCGKVVRGGCLFTWNLIVTMSAVLIKVERKTRPNMTLLLHY